MQSCEKATVAPYPWITSSGSRECLPEEYKRRKCRPGCGSRQALLWDKEKCIQLLLCYSYHECCFINGLFNKIIQCPFLYLYPIIMPGSRTPYCHGRCVFGGRKCFFHPCSPSPYRTSSAETCTKIAFEIEDDQCQRACHYHGHIKCQECIEENLPNQCSELSGSTITSLK